MTDLVRIETPTDLAHSSGAREELLAFEDQVKRLVTDEQLGVLDEARQQAEALSLYQKRKKNAKLEHHFAKCRLMAEAGIGVLSFSDARLVEKTGDRSNWRILASAFERGKLLSFCDELLSGGEGLSTANVVNSLRHDGYSFCPGNRVGLIGSTPWQKAREAALEKDISLESLPPDKAHARYLREVNQQRSVRMERAYRARERLERIKTSKEIAAAAKTRSPKVDEALSSLRRTLQVLHDAQPQFDRVERMYLDEVFSGLYGAEDMLGRLLGVLPPLEHYEKHRRLPVLGKPVPESERERS